jgi:hypothetical protein
VAEVLASDAGDVVVLSPPAESDVLVAMAALETAVSQARLSFQHLVIDLAGLPLRHPGTLGCVDTVLTVAAAGGVREDEVGRLERMVPGERNLGVVLIE